MNRQPLRSAAPVDRCRYVIERCRDKSVLHLGCVDHPFLRERLESGELLHARIHAAAHTLYGVDTSAAGIETMRRAGYDNLFVGDVERLSDIPLDRKFDVIIAGELVEHLQNPGLFLRAVPPLLAEGGHLVVTVPSAQSIRIFANALRGREVVHPDHNAYYSPTTLRHLLESCGLDVEDMSPYWTPSRSTPLSMRLYDLTLRLGRHVAPWLGEGIVAAARARRAT
jgi:predicted TPR repeat methyltransferase